MNCVFGEINKPDIIGPVIKISGSKLKCEPESPTMLGKTTDSKPKPNYEALDPDCHRSLHFNKLPWVTQMLIVQESSFEKG
jgi:hypothetical protein